MIGLVSLIAGFLTLGMRYLSKNKARYMKTTLSNGFIANTSASIVLLFSSSLGFPISCTHVIIPVIYLLRKKEKKKSIKLNKAARAVTIGIAVVGICYFFNIFVSWILLSLNHFDFNYQNNPNTEIVIPFEVQNMNISAFRI